MSRNSDYDKRYYNVKLDKILSKYITSKQYGDFVPILKDIFQRRAYEYEFSDEHIESEVKNFIKKAKIIEFADESEFEKSSIMGLYTPGKKIQLNRTYFSFKMRDYDDIDLGEMLYETLSHEVYHAISDRFNLGVETYDYIKREWNGAALNEVITEVSANRASFSRTTRDFEQGRSKTDGYGDITFVANLMAASLGTTEKEFLIAGIQNRKELMKLFKSKFPSNAVARTAKKEYFDKIEASLDVIYNLNYKERDEDEPAEIGSQLRKSALTTLYKSAYELALFQISNDKTKSRAELADEASFRFLKLEKILFDSAKSFENRRNINKNDANAMHDDIYISRQKLCQKVLALTGKTSYKQLDQYSIYNNSYGRYIMHEDFDDRREWNNRDVAIKMSHALYKDLGINYSEPILGNDKWDTEPIDVVAADEWHTEPIDVVAANRWHTEPVDVVAANRWHTEPIDVVKSNQRLTEPVSVVQAKIPIINDERTELVDIIDEEDRDTEIVSVVDNLKYNGKKAIDKFKQTIDIIVTRFKNRKLGKLNQAREERQEDNSEYYAGLVSNNAMTNELDKYKVNTSALHVENLTVEGEKRKDERGQDEGR